MKLTMYRIWTVAGVIAFALAGFAAQAALSKDQIENITKSLKQTPILELSAKATSIVADVAANDRQDAAIEVIRAVAAKKRASLALVVAAICKAYPNLAPKVAAAAVAEVPELAEDIVFAAIKAAPQEIERITVQVSAVQVAGSTKAASDALAARVRSVARSAAGSSSGVTFSQTAGMMNGSTPSGTPRPPTSTTVFGADPSRYGAP